jgi:hypothetical protein
VDISGCCQVAKASKNFRIGLWFLVIVECVSSLQVAGYSAPEFLLGSWLLWDQLIMVLTIAGALFLAPALASRPVYCAMLLLAGGLGLCLLHPPSTFRQLLHEFVLGLSLRLVLAVTICKFARRVERPALFRAWMIYAVVVLAMSLMPWFAFLAGFGVWTRWVFQVLTPAIPAALIWAVVRTRRFLSKASAQALSGLLNEDPSGIPAHAEGQSSVSCRPAWSIQSLLLILVGAVIWAIDLTYGRWVNGERFKVDVLHDTIGALLVLIGSYRLAKLHVDSLYRITIRGVVALSFVRLFASGPAMVATAYVPAFVDDVFDAAGLLLSLQWLLLGLAMFRLAGHVGLTRSRKAWGIYLLVALTAEMMPLLLMYLLEGFRPGLVESLWPGGAFGVGIAITLALILATPVCMLIAILNTRSEWGGHGKPIERSGAVSLAGWLQLIVLSLVAVVAGMRIGKIGAQCLPDPDVMVESVYAGGWEFYPRTREHLGVFVNCHFNGRGDLRLIKIRKRNPPEMIHTRYEDGSWSARRAPVKTADFYGLLSLVRVNPRGKEPGLYIDGRRVEYPERVNVLFVSDRNTARWIDLPDGIIEKVQDGQAEQINWHDIYREHVLAQLPPATVA